MSNALAIDPRHDLAVSVQDGGFLFSGDQYQVMDYVSNMLEERLGFFVNIDVDADEAEEGFIFYFMHTDNYDDMTEEDLAICEQHNMTPDDSPEDCHAAICELLNIYIQPI